MFRWTMIVAALVLLAAACDRTTRTDSAASDGQASSSPAMDQARPEEQGRIAASAPPAAGLAYQVKQVGHVAARDSISLSMIIRTGHAFIEVDSLELAMAAVRRIADSAGGYLANTSVQTGEGQQRQATLEIRIPSDRYYQATGSLAAIGKVISSSTNTQDVGEEYVDLTARMANARRLEERLVTLLATRTGKLEDVLAVERELARVREEIERYEGRLRYLRTQTAMSTLSITVSEPGPVVGQPGTNPIVESVKQAWRNFVMVIAGGIEVAGGLLPLLAIAALGWILLRRRRARGARQVVPAQ